MHKTKYFVLLALVFSILMAACSAPQTQEVQADAPPPTQSPAATPTAGEEDLEEPLSSSDNPLADVFTAPITAQGAIVIVSGRVLDVNGNPLAGASVEFWQTDVSGVYDHPGDPGTETRDLGFQFYGTAITDDEGIYVFRTVQPGRYEPRPPHIHFKVLWNGAELLTSQIYFADVGSEGGTSAGVDTDPLLMSIEQTSSGDGPSLGMGVFDIVVNTGVGAGSLSLTPGQGEGPYYPLVAVDDFDNDLASVND